MITWTAGDWETTGHRSSHCHCKQKIKSIIFFVLFTGILLRDSMLITYLVFKS